MAPAFGSTQEPCHIFRLPDELLCMIISFATHKNPRENARPLSVKGSLERGSLDVNDKALHHRGRHLEEEANRFLICKRIYGIAEEIIRGSTTGSLSVWVGEDNQSDHYTLLELKGTLCYHRLSFDFVKTINLSVTTQVFVPGAAEEQLAISHCTAASNALVAFFGKFAALQEIKIAFTEDTFEEARNAFQKTLSQFAVATSRQSGRVIVLSFAVCNGSEPPEV